MSKKYRLILMLISLSVLVVVGWFINKSFSFLINDFWFTSGLLLLILLSLVDQPFFSKDCNIFVNAVTASLSLLLVPQESRDVTFWCFFLIVLYLIISSYILMWLRNKELQEENRVIQFISRVNRQIGSPNVLFSAFFIWGAIRQYGINSNEFNALLWFWVIFVILNIPSLASTIESLLEKDKSDNAEHALGKIFGIQAKKIFLIKLIENRNAHVSRFEFVEFLYSVDDKTHRGLVLDVYQLDQEQWVKVLTTPEIDALYENTLSNHVADLIYKSVNPPENDYLNRFIGVVGENSVIEKIKFYYNSKVNIRNGELLELMIEEHKVLYQVVQGITKTEQLEGKNQSGYVVGEAIQLGEWNCESGRFEYFGWVPTINTPIYIAGNISVPSIFENEYQIGSIPNTNYPVILNKEIAVTHHTAILGVTGTGKSVFARNLINQIADEQTRVIIVDLTGEYRQKDFSLKPIIDGENAVAISKEIETLAIEMAKFANTRNQNVIANCEKNIKTRFFYAIKTFLEGEEEKAVFELADITNNAGVLDYTRWFFWVLFNVAKNCKNYGKRVCVVLEEAHTVIPEISTMGTSENASKATVNSIAQIALQGRKYEIGFIVIAQRTANVSKTVLTQCNSIVSFQELDKTTSDFLANYMGRDYVDILPTLKPRMAIAMGKAFRSTAPMLFEVPTIME